MNKDEEEEEMKVDSKSKYDFVSLGYKLRKL
jgi:hypothetical protein